MIGGILYSIGDSMVYGSRDPFGLSPVEVLARKMSDKYNQDWIGVCDGIPGEVSAGLVRRFYRGVAGMKDAYDVLVWIGTNDAKRNVSTPVAMFEENMLSLMRTATFLHKTLYMATLPHQVGFGAPDYVDNKMIDKYNEVIRNLPKKSHAPRCWIVELADIPKEMKIDGIHLTHEGNVWVADRFLKVIESRRS